jgi:hypothetical protein
VDARATGNVNLKFGERSASQPSANGLATRLGGARVVVAIDIFMFVGVVRVALARPCFEGEPGGAFGAEAKFAGRQGPGNQLGGNQQQR